MTDKTNPRPDGSKTQQRSTEPNTFFSRRRLMRSTAGVLGLGALGTAGLWYGTQPSLAATRYEANDGGEVTVTTNAGEVMDVMAAPIVAFNWDNFGDGVDRVALDINVDVGSDTHMDAFRANINRSNDQLQVETGYTGFIEGTTAETDSPNKYTGSGTVAFPEASIMGGGVSNSSFPTGIAQGESVSQTVDLSLRMMGVTGMGRSVSAEETIVSFDVVVENPDGTLTATIDSTNAAATGADSASEAAGNSSTTTT